MPKSIIIKKNGGPEVLELQDVNIGTPGPDEIKVTNHAIGLNYIDTYHRSGLYPLKLPSGIGLEAAGKVEEIGSNVKEFNIGDNIAYASMPLGAYSQQRIVPSKIAVKVPEGHNSFIYLLKGELKIGEKNHSKTSNSNLILLEKGNNLITKAIKKTEFLFIAGKPIGEPIARGGPFVMNTKAVILEAVQDYNNGTFAKY